jgi:hypothetical protein
MSFYQTSNASIVRFRTTPRKTVAPFASLARVAQIETLGQGTGYQSSWNTGVAYNNQFYLSPEMLQNGALIISPIGNSGAGGYYILPSAYDLQEYLGGRFAFNVSANQVNNQTASSNNDFFVLNVYNIAAATGYVVGHAGSGIKPIVAAPAANDAALTPVLLQFNSVNSTYASVNGANNTVSYTVY